MIHLVCEILMEEQQYSAVVLGGSRIIQLVCEGKKAHDRKDADSVKGHDASGQLSASTLVPSMQKICIGIKRSNRCSSHAATEISR